MRGGRSYGRKRRPAATWLAMHTVAAFNKAQGSPLPQEALGLHSLLSSEPRGLREQLAWHGDRNQPRFCLWNPPLLEAGDAIAKDHRAKTKKLLVDKLCNDVVYKDVQGIFFQANQLL